MAGANSQDFVVTFPGKRRVDAEYMGYTIITDQPVDAGGDDSAPSPFILFLASLATCAGVYVKAFCDRRDIPTDGIKIVQKLEPSPMGGIGKIAIEIQVPPEFPKQYYDAVVRSAEQCAVKKTIENPPKFEVKTVLAK